ncbi:MAG: MCP four helix bundle domain-containing protein [Verrucomicrobia bacterium]|nr:MCP four helix bundle domain-containing protein [Verrucomicrobiota bacterium]
MATTSRESTLQSSVRRLKLFIGILVLSNCVLGLFSVTLLRRLDNTYSDLLDQTLPVLSEIRTMGRENTDVYRALVAGIVETDAKLCTESIQRAGKSLERAHAARQQVLKAAILKESPDLLKEMADATAAYDVVSRAIMAKLTPDMTPAEQNTSFNQLEQALERCRVNTRKLQEFVEVRSQAISDNVSAEVRSRSTLVLGIAGWPLVIGILIVITAAVVLVGMFFMLRRIGADDGP